MPKAFRNAVRYAALVAPIVWALVAAPVSAQTCPSSGAGTTCFGGQFFCPVNNQCYSDPRPCPGNLTLDCNSCACACNTSTYPCGGCTSATSATGTSCSGNASCPSSGVYTNQCSVVGCPSGTTLCPSPTPGQCVANRSCPAGTTWDVCTDTCGTPNVLLSPGFTQNGFVSVSGELRSSAGNLRLDSATGGGQGDVYFANGKAVRVDGSGSTLLQMGNWGVGGTGFQLNVIGLMNAAQVCVGGNCRSNWPGTADFDPVYVNAAGDTMTGPLNITGANGDLKVSGNVGIGTTTPGAKLDVVGAVKMINFLLPTSAGVGKVLTSDASGNGAWQSPAFPVTSVSGSGTGITVSPTTGAVMVSNTGVTSLTAGSGISLSGSTGGVTVTNIGIVGGGTANYAAKFTGATTLGNSLIYDNGGAVGVNTTSPVAMLDVNGSASLGTQNTAAGTDAVALGIRNDASGYNSLVLGGYAAATGTGSIAIGGGIDVSRKMTVSGASTIGLGYGSTVPTLTITSAPNTAGTYGKVGVAATAPAVPLAVGGNGANVYATDLWVENNMHVQGNEAMAQGGGRGRLRVGTAWGYPGLYSEGASNGVSTDLVLGASSDHVLINAGSFGRPGGPASFELWGSRIADTGGGTLHIQSGGGVVAFDGGDTVVVNNSLQLGGVARSSWPSLSVISSGATLYTWQGAGWKSVSCPAGYGITGWSGYNCQSHGGEWECSSAYLHSTYVDVWYSAEATAYVGINCAALN